MTNNNSLNISSSATSIVFNELATFTDDGPNELTYDSANDLFYGSTSVGGPQGFGTIFSFNPNIYTLNNSANFYPPSGKSSDVAGIHPSGSLTYDSANGLFYGVAQGGPNLFSGNGTIFSFNPNGNVLTRAASFNSSITGGIPVYPLTYDSGNGLFYGTTTVGGANGAGTLFSFDPNRNVLTKLYDFDNTYGIQLR